MAYYRPTVQKDIELLAPIMRSDDRKEVWHSHGLDPLNALTASVNSSQEANTIIGSNQQVIGLFGYSEYDKDNAIPWILASDDLPRMTFWFVPESKKWVNRISEKYRCLYNYVHFENQTGLRLVEWLGFKLNRKLDNWGVNPTTFIEFVMRRKET